MPTHPLLPKTLIEQFFGYRHSRIGIVAVAVGAYLAGIACSHGGSSHHHFYFVAHTCCFQSTDHLAHIAHSGGEQRAHTRTIKKLGRIKDILSLIPGLNKLPLDQIDEKQLVYVEAVLSSMTPKERKKPQIIDGSRKARIAKGSGTDAARVNAVLKQYESMKEMFKKVGDFAKRQNNGGTIGSNYTPPKDKNKKKKR